MRKEIIYANRLTLTIILNTMKNSYLFLIAFLLLFTACSEYDYFAPMECLTGNVQYDTSGASIKINVASIAMQCDKLPEINILKMENFIEKIVTENPEVTLIVFGEMILGWYEDPDDQESYQKEIAETLPGPTTNRISKLASKYNVYITFGMNQLLDGNLYNAQPVIGPDGSILAIHHKTYLTPADEAAGFQKGNKLTVVNIRGVKTGIVICKDQENSKLTEEVVQNNCKLVIVSFADDIVEDFFTYGSDLSRKYNAWLVSSNRYGEEGEYFYKGEIRVSDPGGNHHIRKEDSEQYLYYSIPIHE
ncbi:MAG: carbon-nitrogen hydrolase family protein [Bacteroidales bacterium]